MPRVKKIKFYNKPISNFHIMNWVKEIKLKNDGNFDGVFNKDSRQDNNKCGIINLDSNNGQGTHWAIYVLFILIPLDYHHPKIYFFLYQTIQFFTISKKDIRSCGYFCLFCIKNSKMVIQFTTFV